MVLVEVVELIVEPHGALHVFEELNGHLASVLLHSSRLVARHIVELLVVVAGRSTMFASVILHRDLLDFTRVHEQQEANRKEEDTKEAEQDKI